MCKKDGFDLHAIHPESTCPKIEMLKPTWGCFDSEHLATPCSCGFFFFSVSNYSDCLHNHTACILHIVVFKKGQYHVALWYHSPAHITTDLLGFFSLRVDPKKYKLKAHFKYLLYKHHHTWLYCKDTSHINQLVVALICFPDFLWKVLQKALGCSQQCCCIDYISRHASAPLFPYPVMCLSVSLSTL